MKKATSEKNSKDFVISFSPITGFYHVMVSGGPLGVRQLQNRKTGKPARFVSELTAFYAVRDYYFPEYKDRLDFPPVDRVREGHSIQGTFEVL